MEKDYRGRYICIVSDSQRAITALGSFQLHSKLVWEEHQSMVKLAERYRIQLVWVPRHMRIDGNEIAGELAKEMPHIHRTWYICRHWQVSDQGLDKHDSRGALAVRT